MCAWVYVCTCVVRVCMCAGVCMCVRAHEAAPPVAEARKFFEKNSYIAFKIFLNFQFRQNTRYGNSRSQR